MAVDGAAGLARRGEGNAVLHGDLGGLARVSQPDLDPLAAEHDGAADRDPSFDDELIGQPGQLRRWRAASGTQEAIQHL